MSTIVFVLGAGASADGGAPLMADFLAVAERLHFQGRFTAAVASDAALALRARTELQAVHSKATLDIENLESVFAAFEMAALRGELGRLQSDEVSRLPAAMRALTPRPWS